MKGSERFQAMVVSIDADGKPVRTVTSKRIDELPEGDVLIRVRYSSLNYKDALSASGNRGVTRNYPHTPGIDAAGDVVESRDPSFAKGQPVLVTGYDLGMNTSGGFGQYIRVPADWVVPLPSGLSHKEAMMLGTAGFTAGLSVNKLIKHGLMPDEGDVLVTGATGGVGTLAVAILTRLGYSIAAASGKPDAGQRLQAFGVRRIVDRSSLQDNPQKALLPAVWHGVVDTVGGEVLACAIKSTHQHAPVTTCGNIASAQLVLTVYPFILRGVTLYGIDSAQTPMPLRRWIWERLASDWKPEGLRMIHREVELNELETEIRTMLAGKGTGRVVVRMG
ncbi:MAG: YhdH/YhfP family quinone oxidoreductase [Thermodesulfobacteriota bacterium]